MLRLVGDHDSVEKKVAVNFDDDPEFISGIVEFLTEVDWVKQDTNSKTYRITEKGKTNTITRKRPLGRF